MEYYHHYSWREYYSDANDINSSYTRVNEQDSSLQMVDIHHTAIWYAPNSPFADMCLTRLSFHSSVSSGAGVGKGRQLAGMIFDSLIRGNSTRHVWLSVSTDLHLEANRDLNAIGCYAKVINGLQTIEKSVSKNWKLSSLPTRLKEGVLFSTYSTLVSGLNTQRGGRKQSRLEQIINWCGGAEFDGLLIFDECHRSKNFKTTADGSIDESSSLTGQAVVRLQAALPKARVVYASATGVTDISNMAYMTRLGIWGEGCGFPDFKTFEKVNNARRILAER